MNQVAQFQKVSYEQFRKDMLACIGIEHKDLNELDVYLRMMYAKIKLPTRATVGSAGYDFMVPFGFSLAAGETVRFPTGIRCLIDDGWVLKIYPRSGLGFKYRVQLDNTVGIIDSDYYFADNEGHIQASVTNDSKQGKEVTLDAGANVMQGVFVPYGVTYTDEADGHRTGGLGSTDG